MKFIRVLPIIAVVFLASPALAQSAAQQPSQEEMQVSVNWQNLQNAILALMQSNKKATDENAALKQHMADMDAYLKACSDSAGCTVPAK